MSRSTLAARFKRTVGQSPLDYLTGWRIELAAERLRRGDGAPVGDRRQGRLQLGERAEQRVQAGHRRVPARLPPPGLCWLRPARRRQTRHSPFPICALMELRDRLTVVTRAHSRVLPGPGQGRTPGCCLGRGPRVPAEYVGHETTLDRPDGGGSIGGVVLVPMAANAVSRDRGPVAAATCATVPVSAPSGTEVESVKAVAHAGGTVTFPAAPPLHPAEETLIDVPAWCDFTVTVSHPGTDDHVNIRISLPQDAKKWNGRFQATGGSAYLAGDLSGAPLVGAVKAGYVAAATDAGVGANPLDVSGWALTPDGRVDTPLLKNFASRSVHDMAVIGKDVAKRFYGRSVSYAYWNGCSTGGRQG